MALLFSLLLTHLVVSVFSNPSCPETKAGMTNVHIVCHTHDDVGWLKTIDQYYYGSRKDITYVGVQYIIDSVVEALRKDPNRKFIYVESAFFYRWWREQIDEIKGAVQSLVDSGQLEFVSGGWCMNDEAAADYNAIIDQMTIGVSKLTNTFGINGAPRVAWQIDPFGHSREQASIFAQLGFDGLFVGRIDHDDKDRRWDAHEMEMVWSTSSSLGSDAFLFTGILPNRYSPPGGFCFDIGCNDEPIMDHKDMDEYNVDQRVEEFLVAIEQEQAGFATSNLIVTMGDDFNYQSAETWYTNLDKLIKYVNERQSNGSMVNLMYSTPSCYLDALHDSNFTWPTKSDDFFPYSSSNNAYWTGYFTSRPTFKGYIRQSNSFLQASKQIAALSSQSRDSINLLANAVGEAQHHDGVSGTAKQHVTDDYSKLLAQGTTDTSVLAVRDGLRSLLNSESDFVFCPLLNISSCEVTENNEAFIVTVYSPIGRSKSYYVRVPVPYESGYTVTDDKNVELVSQMIPIPDAVLNIPGRESIANYELLFRAEDIPPLGTRQFKVQHTAGKRSIRQHSKFEELDDDDFVISNERISLKVDDNAVEYLKIKDGPKIPRISLKVDDNAVEYLKIKDGPKIPLRQEWLWYEGMAKDGEQASGAYVFRPTGPATRLKTDLRNISVVTGGLVTELRMTFDSYVSQVVSLYHGTNYIEIDWLIGPIPVDDNIGKEIVHRITFPKMNTNQTFYTDANGRELQKRIKDYRETWDFQSTEPISQNYYPVTAKIILSSINDQGQAALLNDRAQGGTSLEDGELELMVHRRLLRDDGFGVGEALNEEAYGTGLVARGRHFILHSFLDTVDCDFACQHRTLSEELLYQPLFLFSPASEEDQVAAPDYGLAMELPKNMRLLTLEPWGTGKWLLRLENFYEKDESINSGKSSVDLQYLFSDWTVTDVQEMTLGANQLKSESSRLQWNVESDISSQSGNPDSSKRDEKFGLFTYNFSPMEIRTFIVTITPNLK